MKNQHDNRNNEWETELINRIERIEDDSKKIKTMTKRDYIVVGIIVVICLAAVVAGAFIH